MASYFDKVILDAALQFGCDEVLMPEKEPAVRAQTLQMFPEVPGGPDSAFGISMHGGIHDHKYSPCSQNPCGLCDGSTRVGEVVETRIAYCNVNGGRTKRPMIYGRDCPVKPGWLVVESRRR